MSDEKTIDGLLHQPLVAEAWEAMRNPYLTYTWQPKDAERLKGCLEYGRVDSGAIEDDPVRQARMLAEMALDCAVSKVVAHAPRTETGNPDLHLRVRSHKAIGVNPSQQLSIQSATQASLLDPGNQDTTSQVQAYFGFE